MPTRPIRTVRHHMALVEAAVADYAEALWAATAPPLLRWVRRMLRELRPSIRLLLETRAFDETDALANLIRQLSQGQEPPALAPTLEGLASKISLQYGFLPSDPRAVQLEANYRQMLETDTSSYWRTLTDPATLAGHIVEAKTAGLSLDAIAKQVSNTYRANYPASTRLVRTLYNAGANRAQLEALRASGYTHKQWLATPGPRTRPAHAQANKQVKPLEQPFVVGGYNLMYPGDRSLGAPAGMIVNCRCTLVGAMINAIVEQEPRINSSQPPADFRIGDDRLLRRNGAIEVLGATRGWLQTRYPLERSPQIYLAPSPAQLATIQNRWWEQARQAGTPKEFATIGIQARATRFGNDVVLHPDLKTELQGSLWQRLSAARTLSHEWWHLLRQAQRGFYPFEEGSADVFADLVARQAFQADTRELRRYPLLAQAVEELTIRLGNEWLLKSRKAGDARQYLEQTLLEVGFPKELVQDVLRYTIEAEWLIKVNRLLGIQP